jgi:hypothetical protein
MWCTQILNLHQQILLKARVHIQCYSLSVLPITYSTPFWLFSSMSAHSQPLNLHHTVYIISPIVHLQEETHKTKIQCASFSAQNVTQFINVNITLIIEIYFYTYVSITEWWFSSFCKFKVDFSVSIKYHKTSCAAWNNVPRWQTQIHMDQYQRHTGWQ